MLQSMSSIDEGAGTRPISESAAVLVRVGATVCALPIETVVEIMRPLPIDLISDVPPSVLGLSVVRGEPIPVVDLDAFLGAGKTGSESGRFVILRVRPGGGEAERRVALLVEAVLGIRHLDPKQLVGMPPLLSRAHADVIGKIGVLDKQLLLALEGGRIWIA